MGAPLSQGGRVTHINGTAVVTAAKTVMQATESSWIVIHNTNAAGGSALLVSFDDGKTFFTVHPLEKFEAPVACKQLTVKSSATTAPYEILHITAV